MVREGDVILVHFLATQPVGLTFLRHRNDWPLHVTLLPWFSVSDEAMLIAKLTNLANQTSPFTVRLGKQVMFGPVTEVSLAENGAPLRQLHFDLLDVVARLSAQHRTLQWTGDAYQPHITHHDGQPVPESDVEFSIQDISLVRIADDSICEIVRHFKLRGK